MEIEPHLKEAPQFTGQTQGIFRLFEPISPSTIKEKNQQIGKFQCRTEPKENIFATPNKLTLKPRILHMCDETQQMQQKPQRS